MKLLIRAALLAVSIGSIGSAYAGDGEGPIANTQFNELPNVIAEAPVQSDRAFAAIQGSSGAVRPVTEQYAAAKPAWDQNEGAEG